MQEGGVCVKLTAEFQLPTHVFRFKMINSLDMIRYSHSLCNACQTLICTTWRQAEILLVLTFGLLCAIQMYFSFSTLCHSECSAHNTLGCEPFCMSCRWVAQDICWCGILCWKLLPVFIKCNTCAVITETIYKVYVCMSFIWKCKLHVHSRFQ
jgi:hypothetical protein